MRSIEAKRTTYRYERADAWETLAALRRSEEPPFRVLYSTSCRGISATSAAERIAALANHPDGGIWLVGVYGALEWQPSHEGIGDDFVELIAKAKTLLNPTPTLNAEVSSGVAAVCVNSTLSRGQICFHGDPLLERTFIPERFDTRRAHPDDLVHLRDIVGVSDAELDSASSWTISDLDTPLLESLGIEPDDPWALRDLGLVDEYGFATPCALSCFAHQVIGSVEEDFAIWFGEIDHGAVEAEVRSLEPPEYEMTPGSLLTALAHLTQRLVQWLPVEPRPADAKDLFRELLVNAVGHRCLCPDGTSGIEFAETSFSPASADYMTPSRNKNVMVTAYRDRVRISNPGGLPLGRVRPCGPDRVVGRLNRNPRLMQLLQRFGLARGKGMGLETARRVAAACGCRLEISNSPRSFTVDVIVDAHLALNAGYRGIRTFAESRRLPPEQRRDRIASILADSPLSAATIGEALGWPSSTVRATLKDMLELGLIERTEPHPRSPKQKYYLK